MDAAPGVIYTGVVMAVAIGMTAWRVVAVDGRVTMQTDRALVACLIWSVGLFVAVLLPHYVPGLEVP